MPVTAQQQHSTASTIKTMTHHFIPAFLAGGMGGGGA